MANKDFEFKVIGADKLRKRLDSKNLLLLPLRNYFNATGKIVKEKAKENTPEDTGKLMASIKYKRVQQKGALPRGIKVYSNSPYAQSVHGAITAKHKYKGLTLAKPYSKSNRAKFDRTPPRFVPPQKLKGWSERHDMNPHAVSAGIARDGTPIIPFLKMGYEQSEAERKILLKVATEQVERKWKSKR
jgi:hypothetical protein|tara:strand:+ start:1683 stop:2243 length:561 start_codon:yes stop_codon:yes gene_type:complete